jgi:hypothetical protein
MGIHSQREIFAVAFLDALDGKSDMRTMRQNRANDPSLPLGIRVFWIAQPLGRYQLAGDQKRAIAQVQAQLRTAIIGALA